MSMSTLRPVACRVPPSSGSNGSDLKTSKVTVLFSRKSFPSLQMKEEEKPMMQEDLEPTTRREMMHLTAASIGLFPLVSPLNAKATSPQKATLRQTFFEDLMEKFGFSKSKDDENKEKKSKSENKDTKPKAEEKGKNSEPKKLKPEDKDVNLESKKEAETKKPEVEDKNKVVKNDAEEKKSKEGKPIEEGVKDSTVVKNEAEEKKPKEGLKEDTVVKNDAEEKKPKEEGGLKDKKPVAKSEPEQKKPSSK